MNRPILLLLLAAPTLAWNSGPEGVEGPAAARVIWDDEHRDFYAKLLAERSFDEPSGPITVFTDGSTIDGLATVAPAPAWSEVADSQDRVFEVAMFADLPDFAWSLAGWLGGNEDCPLGEAYSSGCLAFKGWLGGANSTHFPPQSGHAHAFYHGLAVATGERCAAQSADLDTLGYDGSTTYGAFVQDIREQCELEALAFEGIAQHYLQDSWSSGHMWQRWGSPAPSDWSNVAHALVVGSIAGLIHGHEPLTGIADPLCAPDPDVAFVSGRGAGPDACVGDLYLDEMLGTSTYPVQLSDAWSCTGGSLDEVTEALAGDLGGTSQGLGPPDDPTCFDQRVTNQAYYTGMFATWHFSADRVASTIRTVARLRFLALALPPPLPELVVLFELAFRREATAMAILLDASRWSRNNPRSATNFAEGIAYDDTGTALPLTVLGMGPNGDYASQIDATDGFQSFDPPASVLQTGTGGTAQQQADADRIRRGLHRAHADWWCDTLTVKDDASDLGGMRAACHADPEGNAAACDLCGEMALRHHRIGSSVDDYDADQEPVCHALAADPGYVYVGTDGYEDEADPRLAAVRDWCRADCAVAFVVDEVVTGAADAADEVDADVVLGGYLDQLIAYSYYFGAESSYWLSIGQYSLANYYAVLRDNVDREIVGLATLMGALGNADQGQTRFEGGPVEDDYVGPLAELVGYATAPMAEPDAIAWDDLTGSQHRFLTAPGLGDTYPLLVLFDLKTSHVRAEDGVVFHARNFLWIDAYFNAWTPAPELTLLLDGVPWVSGTTSDFAAQTVQERFVVGEQHELAVRLDATVYDPDTLPALEKTVPLQTTLFSVRFTVQEGGDDAACE